MILAKEQYGKSLDKAVFPGIQEATDARYRRKAVAFAEALRPEFTMYQQQVVKNSKVLAAALLAEGADIVSGGTDNHLALVKTNISPLSVTGIDAETMLDDVGITVNKNLLPFDSENAAVTSGIRIGTPAVTTRGMKENEMKTIAQLIGKTLKARGNVSILNDVKADVLALCGRFPLYE